MVLISERKRRKAIERWLEKKEIEKRKFTSEDVMKMYGDGLDDDDMINILGLTEDDIEAAIYE